MIITISIKTITASAFTVDFVREIINFNLILFNFSII